MKKIEIGTVVDVGGKFFAVVEVLDCPASYDALEVKPELPAVSVSPIKGNRVMGRTRRVVNADCYKVVNYSLAVRDYPTPKEDNII